MSQSLCYDEPVVLTLSSDDDDDDDEDRIKNNNTSYTNSSVKEDQGSQVHHSNFSEPINPKEPTVMPNFNYEYYHLFHKKFPEFEKETEASLDENTFLYMQCRSLRIGSYKVVPHDKVLLTFGGFKVSIPPFTEGDQNPVTLFLHLKGIRKVLAHFGNSLPVIFIYVTDKLADAVRNHLKMIDRNGFYFDPCSHEESQKRITLLPEKMKQESINIFKNILMFELVDPENGERLALFEELSLKDANEILVRSSPVEIESLASNSRTVFTYETRTLLVFPPPPNKGGITITMDDYCCLKDEQFLNDVLLDFYLKWLHMRHISKEDRDRTHIFSTFFYKRLTSKPKNTLRRHHTLEDDPTLSPAQRRHSRVQSWTKNVDIFTKDFILIPINEQSHWFLAVICFPYLNGPVRAKDNVPIPASEVTLFTRRSSRKRRRIEIPVIDDFDNSDRDEAEGDDTELVDDDDFGEDENNGDEFETSKKRPKNLIEEPIKQPCILILDSLAGSPRSRIVSTLRDYLSVEYEKRKNMEKKFTKETMMGSCPKVPQQMNYSDCGLFTLQFAESFFKRPLQDFSLPIRCLSNWFNQNEVTKKRESVASLIKCLMDEYKPDHGITLPPIFSSSASSSAETVFHSSKEDPDKNCVREESSLKESKEEEACSREENSTDTREGKSSTRSKSPAEEMEPNNVSSASPAAQSGISGSIKYLFSLMESEERKNKDAVVVDERRSLRSGSDGREATLNLEEENKDNERTEPKPEKGKCEGGRVNDALKLLCDSYDTANSDEDDIFQSSRSKRHKIATIDL